MSTQDFLMDREITPIDFYPIWKLSENFNNTHKFSHLITRCLDRNNVKITYKSRSGIEDLYFKSYREAERWIRYNTYADID